MGKNELEYHSKQWDEPKRSTVDFTDFITQKIKVSDVAFDVGCGLGGSIFYISTKHPKCNFIGIDLNKS